MTLAIITAILLLGLFLIPFLIKEMRDGKAELGALRKLRPSGVVFGPTVPAGIGDNNPGRVGDPAPGQPDAQADPYGPRAQRGGPPVQS